jgi:hypothetical protein
MPDYDSAATLRKSPPKSLAAFLAAGTERARLWRPEELSAIFKHQMSSPILVDLGGFDPATAMRLKLLSESQSLLLKSFSDLFHHPVPPLELLTLTKEFAKANMDHPESSLPPEIAGVLYYASIATALVRLDARISQLNPDKLQFGLLWAREQPWVDDRTREILQQALDKIVPIIPAKETPHE